MISNILRKLNGILLFLIGIPLALSEQTDEEIVNSVLRPNLAKGILGIPIEIQKWLTWAISVVFVFAVAYKIIQIFRESALAEWSKKQNRSEERAEHIENIFHHAIILVVMIVAILFIIFISTRL